MSTARRIVKNTTVLFIATVIGYIFGLFTTMYSARYLGANGFGTLSLALSLTSIFGILTDLGLTTLIVREIARDKSLTDKYISNTILIKIILTFITFILLIITTIMFDYSELTSNVVYIVAFSVIFGSFSNIFYSVYQSYEKLEYQSVANILNAALIFLGVLIARNFNFDIYAFAYIYFIAGAVVLVYNIFIYSWKFVLSKLSIDLDFWSPTLKEALPFAVTGIFTMIYFWIDSVILFKMKGNEVVGWYNAAYRLIMIFSMLYSVYMVSIFPVMSGFYKTSKESIKITFERSFKYLLIISLPVAIATAFWANEIILIIYGAEYIPAVIALQILIWSIIFMFVNSLSLNLLGSVNRQTAVAKIIVFGAVSNIILNILLIRQFSYLGSAVATVITELLMLPVFLHVLLKTEYVEVPPLLKDIPKVVISNVVLVIVILYLNNFNIFLAAILGVLVYLIMIIITRALDKEDLKIIKGIFKG